MRLLRYVRAAAIGSVLTLLALAAPAKEPKIHACRDASGNLVCQYDPCPETPLAAAGAPATSQAPERTVDRAASIAVPPSSTAGQGSRPQAWTVGETARRDRSSDATGRTPRPPSGGFGSPKQTWSAFVAAIGSGDRAAAAACLTPSALARLGAETGAFPFEKLREAIKSFTRVEAGDQVGPFWFTHASRPDARPVWIFFERTARGEWKIASI